MVKKLDFLPAARNCNCSDGAQNCLPPQVWHKRQTPIWRFNNREIYGSFERYSRRVHPATFHRALAYRIIETYTHTGETVLDPFSGCGTTLVAAAELGRHAVGLELNARFADISKRRLSYIREIIKNKFKKDAAPGSRGQPIPITHAVQFKSDARKMMELVPCNSIDLVMTSPPYWDMLKQKPSLRNRLNGRYLKKNYSNDSRDFSNMPSLDSFRTEMGTTFYQVRHVLKPGGRFVIITGDYRRRGVYIPLHGLYIKQLTDLGLELNNIIIWDRSNEYDIGLFSYPYYFLAANGMVEYILEFRKKR